MSIEGLTISCIIDSMEVQDVATNSIPGDFLQTNNKKGDININLEGVIVTLPEDIDPDYNKYFIYKYKRGRK